MKKVLKRFFIAMAAAGFIIATLVVSNNDYEMEADIPLDEQTTAEETIVHMVTAVSLMLGGTAGCAIIEVKQDQNR